MLKTKFDVQSVLHYHMQSLWPLADCSVNGMLVIVRHSSTAWGIAPLWYAIPQAVVLLDDYTLLLSQIRQRYTWITPTQQRLIYTSLFTKMVTSKEKKKKMHTYKNIQ